MRGCKRFLSRNCNRDYVVIYVHCTRITDIFYILIKSERARAMRWNINIHHMESVYYRLLGPIGAGFVK